MNENDYGFYDYIKPILLGTLISLISMGVLMFIISLAMTKVDFPLGFVSPAASAIIGISTFIGSVISAKSFQKKGFFIGLCIAMFVFIVMLLLNLSIDPQGFGTTALVKAAVTLVCGVVGGILGVNKRRSAKIKI